ncbi:hypothetical protein PsorP6_009122 [Peronosclerospora sorghi]|uniref:Uncharacterized protein n=1 Tax=Peronosclerospora sorghi TaxID=230839 RepID=A0ACC0VX87_9STRA|nr:hypothetical protein PsorP6_009122 [Peronosclerospora sorghi]
MLRPGGMMIYIYPLNRMRTVSKFLEAEPLAKIDSIPYSKDVPCKEGILQGTIRFTPSQNTSGLFIARIYKDSPVLEQGQLKVLMVRIIATIMVIYFFPYKSCLWVRKLVIGWIFSRFSVIGWIFAFFFFFDRILLPHDWWYGRCRWAPKWRYLYIRSKGAQRFEQIESGGKLTGA